VFHRGVRIRLIGDWSWVSQEALKGRIEEAYLRMGQFTMYGADKELGIKRLGDGARLVNAGGVKTIELEPRGKPPIPPPPKVPKDIILLNRSPIACYDLFNFIYFSGYYACSTLAWNPWRRIEPDYDRPYAWNNYDNINADGRLNQIPEDEYSKGPSEFEYAEIYELPKIGLEDYEDEIYSSSTVTNKGDFIPGANPDIPAWFSAHGCVGDNGNCFWPSTGSYLCTNADTAYTLGIFWTLAIICLNPSCDCDPPEYFYGETQTQEYSKYDRWGYTFKIGEEVVKTCETYFWETIYSVASGYGCSSYSRRENFYSMVDVYMLGTSTVRGSDNYEDDGTWMIIYTEYVSDSHTVGISSPWMHPPYREPLVPVPYAAVTQRFYVSIKTPKGVAEFEFADSATGSDLHCIETVDYSIYDFHGKPVFIFSWMDERDRTMNYAAIYEEKLFYSERFVMDNQDCHIVGNSMEQWNARAEGKCRALGKKVVRRYQE
jgi:hypothetical protein